MKGDISTGCKLQHEEKRFPDAISMRQTAIIVAHVRRHDGVREKQMGWVRIIYVHVCEFTIFKMWPICAVKKDVFQEYSEEFYNEF